MPLNAAAIAELRSILQSFRAAHTSMAVPTGAGKALEAFIFFKLAQAVQNVTPLTWQVSLHRGDGTPLTASGSFDLPGGPSRIQASSPLAPCYVLLQSVSDLNLAFELRGSVQWIGRSQTRHEIDISVLPAVIGKSIRDTGGGYPHGFPIASIECKDKDDTGSLDEARQTLARMFDLAPITPPLAGLPCRIFERNSPSYWGKRSSKYRSYFDKSHLGIVRAGTFSSGGVVTLSQHYYINCYPHILTSQSSIQQLQNDFIENLARASDY